MDDDRRRLLARAVRAEEDAQVLRERLEACYREVDEVRALVPTKPRQVAIDAPASSRASDPLVRLFAALRPQAP
jgi:hypothetical protein